MSTGSDDHSMRRSDLAAAVVGAEDYLKSPVHLGRALSGSIVNTVHEIRVDGKRMILKFGEESGIKREYAVLLELKGRRLPVPRAELVKASAGGPGVVLLMDAWDGAAAEEDSPALVGAGRALRHLHSLEKNGFGPVDPSASEVRGSYSSWSAYVDHLLERAWSRIPEAVLDAELRGLILTVVQESADSLSHPGNGVLLHGDLAPRHVWCHDERFVGLIDWGDAMVGDPVFDIARASLAGPTALKLLMSGYGQEVELDARLLSLYRLLWSLSALTGECEAGGDWLESYLNIIIKEAAAG
ncbi:aminoglycoside phosphotransferase family protein [Streptosporangium sp. KLBMP 9127]|nr:aminoglycoside phosphotransferase family protein [Streptosporangium sp. KLBMP 9127]